MNIRIQDRAGLVGWGRSLVAFSAMIAAGACDLSVTNPGPVQDNFLNDRAAHPAIVNGMGRDLSEALNYVALNGASVTREVHPAGSQGAFGILLPMQRGLLPEDHSQTNSNWLMAQRARWVAESGIRRLAESLSQAEFSSSPLVAQAYLWAGYANRLLGENMCEAVIDGGPAQPNRVYFERADSTFTRAAEIAGSAGRPQIAAAARAGRASVRAYLGEWNAAVADAASIPRDFVYAIPYFSIDTDQYNRVYWSSANQPFRAHTTWNTVYESYYTETQDPRTPWNRNPSVPVGDAAVLDLGTVPWYFQLKHDNREAPINLSTGREMRLIEAEAQLRNGEWQAAMAIINSLRAEVGVPEWEASGTTEAWTRLKRERGIELWLEGRRLGDLRRWAAEDAPGQLDQLEMPGAASNLDPNRALCFPIPRSERETNPNIPL